MSSHSAWCPYLSLPPGRLPGIRHGVMEEEGDTEGGGEEWMGGEEGDREWGARVMVATGPDL